jgi:hypothetical protein
VAIHGSDYGIDAITLVNLPWANIGAWRPAVGAKPARPVFAGRYFFPGHVWAAGESAGIKHAAGGNPARNSDLSYVFPLQGPGAPPFNRAQGLNAAGHRQPDETVQKWGEDDAKATCTKIQAVVNTGELKFQSFCESVIVYLDIEPGVNLSANYWYGWARKVYWFCTGLHRPFYPGLYCATMHNPAAAGGVALHRIPTGPGGPFGDVQTGLNGPPSSLASRCYGLYATAGMNGSGFLPIPANPPGDEARYRPNFYPDWENRFDPWVQTVHMIFELIPWHTTVPVLLWQYAAQSTDPAHPTPAAFNALQVDLDETDPAGEGIKWMLMLP